MCPSTEILYLARMELLNHLTEEILVVFKVASSERLR